MPRMTGVSHKQHIEARTLELASMAKAMHEKAEEIEELRRQKTAEIEARECPVCLEPADCVYLCGHQICVGCATKMQFTQSPCPVCRAPCTGFVKLYMLAA